MRHPLTFLLRIGRSHDECVSLLGDLEEEHRTRLARGSGRLAAFAWFASEIVRALAWGLRDAFRRRAFAPPASHPTSTHRRHSPLSMLSWPDIKLSLRLLIRHPGLTLVSSVGITVGIAITAGMFGFMHTVFAPTLPLDEGDRIIALENWDVAKNNENRQSLHDFVTWRDQMKSVVEISALAMPSGAISAMKVSGVAARFNTAMVRTSTPAPGSITARAP